jgi:hypothetical protein
MEIGFRSLVRRAPTMGTPCSSAIQGIRSERTSNSWKIHGTQGVELAVDVLHLAICKMLGRPTRNR